MTLLRCSRCWRCASLTPSWRACGCVARGANAAMPAPAHAPPAPRHAAQGKDFPFKRLAVMLLSNLCQTMEGCIQLLQQDVTGAAAGLRGLHFRLLLQWFVTPAAKFADDVAEDPFEFAGSIIHNCTQLAEARRIILEPERGILQALLPQLASASTVRRRGTAGAVRNCCFEVTRVDWLLSPAVDVVGVLGRPLVGPTPFRPAEAASFPDSWCTPDVTAAHEPDAATRLLLLEALLVLASHRPAREAMRKANLYAVVRNLHYWLEGVDPPFAKEAMAAGTASSAKAAARGTAEEAAALASRGGAVEVSQDAVGATASASSERAHVADGEGRGDLPPLDEKAADVINQLVQYLQRGEEGEEGADGAEAPGAPPGTVPLLPAPPMDMTSKGSEALEAAGLAPTEAAPATDAAGPEAASPPPAPAADLAAAMPQDGRVERMLDRHVHTVEEPAHAGTVAARRAGLVPVAEPAREAGTSGSTPPAQGTGSAGALVDAAGFGDMD